MRMIARLTVATSLLALALLAGPARAGGVFEASAGSGFRIDPTPVKRIPTNVMLTAGYAFPVLVKLELGVAGNLGDVKDSKFDLDLRPMVVIAPPIVPIYARGILGVGGLLEKPTHLVWGGALGFRVGLFGAGVFAEAGAISRRVDWPNDAGTGTHRKDVWLGEGRLGVYFD